MTLVADSVLDEILAMQMTLAWAGERGEPARLGWWNTDLVDEAAAGDLFARLTPRTAPWASLASVREVARRVDAVERQKFADADGVRTAFALGFALDERLDDRLRELTRQRASLDALPWPVTLDRFSLPDLQHALRADRAEFLVVSNGRQLKSAPPEAPAIAVRQLCAANLAGEAPSRRYPVAFFRVKS
jgi:hypothetical protein